MFNRSASRFAAVAVAASLVTAGCATTGGEAQEQAGGAVVGALLGCGIGALTTGKAEGCAAGAVAGAVAGWGAVKIRQGQVRKVSSEQENLRLFGLTKPVDSPLVKIKNGSSSPKTVRPGQTVTITTDYAVLLPPSESAASVEESWTLKKDGKTLTSQPAKAAKRSAGGFARDWELDMPADSAPGTYDTDKSTFVVKS